MGSREDGAKVLGMGVVWGVEVSWKCRCSPLILTFSPPAGRRGRLVLACVLLRGRKGMNGKSASTPLSSYGLTIGSMPLRW